MTLSNCCNAPVEDFDGGVLGMEDMCTNCKTICTMRTHHAPQPGPIPHPPVTFNAAKVALTLLEAYESNKLTNEQKRRVAALLAFGLTKTRFIEPWVQELIDSKL